MTANSAQIAGYYDKDVTRALRDWVYGNPRISAAIERCKKWLPQENGRILDVGCGIGTSSFAFAQAAPAVEVLGVDISPDRISVAKRLFEKERISFSVSDMTVPPAGGPYDLVTMIDVYEHIPRDDRGDFHQVLDACLATTGVFVMTCPSPFHQQYLTDHEPGGLQIVDETITLDDVRRLAADVRGTVLCYELVDVWMTNQYLHVVIARSPIYGHLPRTNEPRSFWSQATRKLSGLWRKRRENRAIASRRETIRSRVGIEI
jgi:SAM-dependent methyltransferase